jgi:hypothetical protein
MPQMGFNSNGKNKEKRNEGGKVINQTPSKNVYCRYKDFMKLP